MSSIPLFNIKTIYGNIKSEEKKRRQRRKEALISLTLQRKYRGNYISSDITYDQYYRRYAMVVNIYLPFLQSIDVYEQFKERIADVAYIFEHNWSDFVEYLDALITNPEIHDDAFDTWMDSCVPSNSTEFGNVDMMVRGEQVRQANPHLKYTRMSDVVRSIYPASTHYSDVTKPSVWCKKLWDFFTKLSPVQKEKLRDLECLYHPTPIQYVSHDQSRDELTYQLVFYFDPLLTKLLNSLQPEIKYALASRFIIALFGRHEEWMTAGLDYNHMFEIEGIWVDQPVFKYVNPTHFMNNLKTTAQSNVDPLAFMRTQTGQKALKKSQPWLFEQDETHEQDRQSLYVPQIAGESRPIED